MQNDDPIKRQTKRYTNEELEIIRTTFKDNDELLILLRRFILQDETLEKDAVKYLKETLGTPLMMAVLRKTICPLVDKGAPINQTMDMFSGLKVDELLEDHALNLIEARHRVVKFFNQQLDAIEGKDTPNPMLFDTLHITEGKTKTDAYVDFVARNFIFSFIESQGLRQLLVQASLEETPAEIATKRAKNSTK